MKAMLTGIALGLILLSAYQFGYKDGIDDGAEIAIHTTIAECEAYNNFIHQHPKDEEDPDMLWMYNCVARKDIDDIWPKQEMSFILINGLVKEN